MGIITTSEAVHRLQLIGSKVTNAVREIREMNWQEGFEDAGDAIAMLNTLLPHLQEAAHESVGSRRFNPPQPQERIGGLGYRGSVHVPHVPHTPPPMRDEEPEEQEPLPIKGFSPRPIPSPIPRPIPTPARYQPRKPIITPPPPVRMIAETRTFDPSLIVGQEEHYRRVLADPNTKPDWEMTEAFDRLSLDEQNQVVAEYRKTGKPVSV